MEEVKLMIYHLVEICPRKWVDQYRWLLDGQKTCLLAQQPRSSFSSRCFTRPKFYQNSFQFSLRQQSPQGLRHGFCMLRSKVSVYQRSTDIKRDQKRWKLMTFDVSLCKISGRVSHLFFFPGQKRDYSFNRGNSDFSYKNAMWHFKRDKELFLPQTCLNKVLFWDVMSSFQMLSSYKRLHVLFRMTWWNVFSLWRPWFTNKPGNLEELMWVLVGTFGKQKISLENSVFSWRLNEFMKRIEKVYVSFFLSDD